MTTEHNPEDVVMSINGHEITGFCSGSHVDTRPQPKKREPPLLYRAYWVDESGGQHFHPDRGWWRGTREIPSRIRVKGVWGLLYTRPLRIMLEGRWVKEKIEWTEV